jgi:hypothetical protein
MPINGQVDSARIGPHILPAMGRVINLIGEKVYDVMLEKKNSRVSNYGANPIVKAYPNSGDEIYETLWANYGLRLYCSLSVFLTVSPHLEHQSGENSINSPFTSTFNLKYLLEAKMGQTQASMTSLEGEIIRYMQKHKDVFYAEDNTAKESVQISSLNLHIPGYGSISKNTCG